MTSDDAATNRRPWLNYDRLVAIDGGYWRLAVTIADVPVELMTGAWVCPLFGATIPHPTGVYMVFIIASSPINPFPLSLPR